MVARVVVQLRQEGVVVQLRQEGVVAQVRQEGVVAQVQQESSAPRPLRPPASSFLPFSPLSHARLPPSCALPTALR